MKKLHFNILSLPTIDHFHIRKYVARKKVHCGCICMYYMYTGITKVCMYLCMRMCVYSWLHVCTCTCSCCPILCHIHTTHVSSQHACYMYMYVKAMLVCLARQLFCNVQVHGCVHMIRKSRSVSFILHNDNNINPLFPTIP